MFIAGINNDGLKELINYTYIPAYIHTYIMPIDSVNGYDQC